VTRCSAARVERHFRAAALLIVVLPLAHLALPAGHPLHVSSFWITLLGKFMCYAWWRWRWT